VNRIVIALLALAPVCVSAAEWKGEGELGYTSTAGNSDAETLNAKLAVTVEYDQWKHVLGLSALQASSNKVRSAERYEFTHKSNYAYSDKSYVFASLRYDNDQFSGYDYQSSLAAGIGSQLIKTAVHSLDVAVGPGYRSMQDSVTGQVDNRVILKLDAQYAYQISEYASLSEVLTVESGSDNTYTESITSLKMKINGNLSSKISYTIKQNSVVPVGTERTDTLTSVSLVYGF